MEYFFNHIYFNSILAKFLPMKTMLGPKYDDKVQEENRFHPSMLSNYLKSLKVRWANALDDCIVILKIHSIHKLEMKNNWRPTWLKMIKCSLKRGHTLDLGSSVWVWFMQCGILLLVSLFLFLFLSINNNTFFHFFAGQDGFACGFDQHYPLLWP